MRGREACIAGFACLVAACNPSQEQQPDAGPKRIGNSSPYHIAGEGADSIVAFQEFDEWSFSPIDRLGRWDSVTLPRTDVAYCNGEIIRITERFSVARSHTEKYQHYNGLTFTWTGGRDQSDSTIWLNFFLPQQQVTISYLKNLQGGIEVMMRGLFDPNWKPTQALRLRADSIPELYSYAIATPSSRLLYERDLNENEFIPWVMPKTTKELLAVKRHFKQEDLARQTDILEMPGGKKAQRTITFNRFGESPDTVFEEISEYY